MMKKLLGALFILVGCYDAQAMLQPKSLSTFALVQGRKIMKSVIDMQEVRRTGHVFSGNSTKPKVANKQDSLLEWYCKRNGLVQKKNRS